MPSGLLPQLFGQVHFQYYGCLIVIIIIINIIEIPVFIANSEDPDQTPLSVASDLGIYCLPMSFSWGTRQEWV